MPSPAPPSMPRSTARAFAAPVNCAADVLVDVDVDLVTAPVPVPAREVGLVPDAEIPGAETGTTGLEPLDPLEGELEFFFELPPSPASIDGETILAFLANSLNVSIVRDLFLAGLMEEN